MFLLQPTEPPVPVPAGKGIPLGHISNVEVSLSRFKTQDQKLLHQYLYGVSLQLIMHYINVCYYYSTVRLQVQCNWRQKRVVLTFLINQSTDFVTTGRIST